MKEHFYMGAVPKNFDDSNFASDIVRSYREFRIAASYESNSQAFTQSNLDVERQRDLESHMADLQEDCHYWFACFVGEPGLQGRVFRNVSLPPHDASVQSAEPNDDDKELVRSGKWVGGCFARGPLLRSEWVLPTLADQSFSDDIETRFHLSSLYILDEFRGARLPDKASVGVKLLYQGMVDTLREIARTRTARRPAYLRTRATILPKAVEAGRLVEMYKKSGNVITGWVPQVTVLKVNGTKVLNWPSVDEDPDFYTACTAAVFEKLHRLDEDERGWQIISPDVDSASRRERARI